MKTVSTSLQAYLNWAGGLLPVVQVDLWTFNLRNGLQLNYSTADFAVYAPTADHWQYPKVDGSGNLWTAPMSWVPACIDTDETKALAHWKRGLDSDTISIKFAPRMIDPVTGAAYPDRIGSLPFLQAAAGGLLNYCDVILSRAYFNAMPTWPMPLVGATPIGTLCIFRGQSGQVDLTSTAVYLTVNDYKAILAEQMPKNLYQASCRHRVFDARCTLNAASYTGSGTAAAGSTQTVIVASVAAPGGSGTFRQGTLTMTSGLNQGLSVQVTQWAGGLFSLLEPLPFTVAAGDTFSVTAGCDKTTATCNAFGNLVNFGGDPFIPVPEVTLG